MKRVRIITKTRADVSMSNDLWFDDNDDVFIEFGEWDGVVFSDEILNKNLIVYKSERFEEVVYVRKKEDLEWLAKGMITNEEIIPWFLVDKEVEIVYDFESIEDMIDHM